jgi:hypothetical protein
MNKKDESLEKIVDVVQIRESVVEITERSRIPKVVEKPLIKACELFYDKNIKTLMSSANYQDVGEGRAYIRIDYDTLSLENKKIAKRLCKFSGDSAYVEIPVDKDTTVEALEKKFLETAEKFKPQPLLWGGYKKEEIEKLAKKAKEYSGETGVKFFEKIKENFLPETGLSYRSKELYEKAKNYAKSKK